MLLELVTYPDARLKTISKPVEEITPELRLLATNMLETMYQSSGVGLAAPQVGHFIRLLVMDANAGKEDMEKQPRVLINPQLELSGSDVISENEGCLSVPMNYRANVLRKSNVHLQALDLDGKKIDEYLIGYPAIIVQHEADHLDGVLFIDHLSHLKRSLFDSRLKKWLKRKNAK